MHCFLKWLRLFIGGLNTGADPRKKFVFINDFVNSKVILCLGPEKADVAAMYSISIVVIHGVFPV